MFDNILSRTIYSAVALGLGLSLVPTSYAAQGASPSPSATPACTGVEVCCHDYTCQDGNQSGSWDWVAQSCCGGSTQPPVCEEQVDDSYCENVCCKPIVGTPTVMQKMACLQQAGVVVSDTECNGSNLVCCKITLPEGTCPKLTVYYQYLSPAQCSSVGSPVDQKQSGKCSTSEESICCKIGSTVSILTRAQCAAKCGTEAFWGDWSCRNAEPSPRPTSSPIHKS